MSATDPASEYQERELPVKVDHAYTLFFPAFARRWVLSGWRCSARCARQQIPHFITQTHFGFLSSPGGGYSAAGSAVPDVPGNRYGAKAVPPAAASKTSARPSSFPTAPASRGAAADSRGGCACMFAGSVHMCVCTWMCVCVCVWWLGTCK
jgi:hypothetical protein